MKKALVMTLAILFLFGSLAFAGGDKVRGEDGDGNTYLDRTPLQGIPSITPNSVINNPDALTPPVDGIDDVPIWEEV